MNRFKLLCIELVIALLLSVFISYMYVQDTLFFENMNKKFTDMFFHVRGELKANDNIVIVDIDEKSLDKLGQWPWGRDKVANILENLTNAEVGIIGLDIAFAEADNSSPKKILEKFGLTHKDAKDHDLMLSDMLKSSPTVMGYIFDFEEVVKKGNTPNISTVIVEKNKTKTVFLPKAKGLIANIPVLQDSAYSSGFFNTIPDNDGIVRSVPLVAIYEDTIFPSLSLEMIRLIYGSQKIVINYTSIGITSIKLDDLEIPTDRFGRLSVNYKGKSKLHKYISAIDVYNNEFKKDDIAGKLVLLGTSAGGLLDLRATPFESTFAGVEIHATAIGNMLEHSFISYPSWIEAVDILIMVSLLIFMVIVFTFFGAVKTALLSTLGIVSFICFSYFLFIEEGIVLNIIYPLSASMIMYMILTSLHYLFESRQKELIKNKFSKKVSQAVAESLIKQGNKDILEAKEKEISIFFSDIRGFTSISEQLANPKKLIDFLNLYMTPMTEIITKNQGTVDKFIGDAIMAYWNAPLNVENHADKTLNSAIEQLRELENLNIYLKEQNLPRIDIGIGINSGLAVVGEMGSSGRSDYTVIGDSVNLASRLEGLCKPYGAKIIISEYTKEKLTQKYNIRILDKVRVKGKTKPVCIYEVMLNEDSLIYEFEKAFELYQQGLFEKALKEFEKLQINSDIVLYKLYITRCKYFIKNPPKYFDGVFVYTTK